MMKRIIYVILILTIFICGCNQDKAFVDNVTIVQIHWTNNYVLFAADGHLGGGPELPGWSCDSGKYKDLFVYFATPEKGLKKLSSLNSNEKIRFVILEIDLFDDQVYDPIFTVPLDWWIVPVYEYIKEKEGIYVLIYIKPDQAPELRSQLVNARLVDDGENLNAYRQKQLEALIEFFSDTQKARMCRIFDAIEWYYYVYGEYPKGDTSQVIEVLQNASYDPNNPDKTYVPDKLRITETKMGFRYSFPIKGPILGTLRTTKRKVWFFRSYPPQIDENGNPLDEWGHPMELEIKESENKIFIKSLGKNGKDDGGGGDDFIMMNEYPPKDLEEIPHPFDYTQRNRPIRIEKAR